MSVQQLEETGRATGVTFEVTGPRAARDGLSRTFAVLALGVTAVVHVPVAVQHVDEIPYLGYAFYAVVLLAAAALGSLLVESRTSVWTGALALSLGAVLAYVVSRTVGLPLSDDDIGHWADPLGLVAVVAELVVVVVAVGVLRRRRHDG